MCKCNCYTQPQSDQYANTAGSSTGMTMNIGWTCATCGAFVPFGQMHSCFQQPQISGTYTFCTCSQLVPILERIEKLLVALVEQTAKPKKQKKLQ